MLLNVLMFFRRVGLFSTEVAPLTQLKSLATNVQTLGVPCEILSSADIKRKFPTFKLQGYEGTFEPRGGFILANQALSAMQVNLNYNTTTSNNNTTTTTTTTKLQ